MSVIRRYRRAVDVHAIRREVRAARMHPFLLPQGHVAAMAAARVFGPFDATTPEGHPVLILSGPFDLTAEAPQSAIARAAYRWHGIIPHPAHWEIEMQKSVNIPADHPMHGRIRFQEFFHLRYLPEAWKWSSRGLHSGNVPNAFSKSWYLTQDWKQEKA